MKKSYPVTIDKPRSLRYGFVALNMIEEALDKPVTSIRLDAIRIKEVAVLTWGGLYHEDKTLTPDRILELFDEHDIDYTQIMLVVGQALAESFGVEEDEKK